MQNINSDAEKIEKIYSSIVPNYDLFNHLLSFNLDRHWRKQVADKCRLPEGGKGLDICCGTGDLTIELARRLENGEIIGLDFSADMLECAGKKLAEKKLACRVSFVKGNALELPFADSVFDCAANTFGLRASSNLPEAIKEMKRVVKKDGRVVIAELFKPKRWLIKKGFNFYIFFFLPLLGKLPLLGNLVGGAKGPYASYLPESIAVFPEVEQVTKIFQQSGLVNVEHTPLLGGVVEIVYGEKKE